MPVCVCSAGHGRGHAQPLFTRLHKPLSTLMPLTGMDAESGKSQDSRTCIRKHVLPGNTLTFTRYVGGLKGQMSSSTYMVFMLSVWKPPEKSLNYVWTVLCLVTRVVFVVNAEFMHTWVWPMVIWLYVETLLYWNKELNLAGSSCSSRL